LEKVSQAGRSLLAPESNPACKKNFTGRRVEQELAGRGNAPFQQHALIGNLLLSLCF